MSNLIRGTTIAPADTVTNTTLHTLFDSASLTGVLQSDLNSSKGLVHIGPSSPSDTDQLWLDTLTTPYTLKLYDGTNWVGVVAHLKLTNTTGQTTTPGQVVIVDTANDNSAKYTSSQSDRSIAGIIINSVQSGSAMTLASKGFGLVVLTELSTTAGTFLRSSTATGKADLTSQYSQGVFGILTVSANLSGQARIFGSMGNGISSSDANTWTGAQTFATTTLNGITTMTTASAATSAWSPIIQVVNTITGASASGTTQIPSDDTIPQSGEGDQYMTLAITPKHSNNLLIIDAIVNVAHTASNILTVALFQDSTANALASVQMHNNTNNRMHCIYLRHYMTAGTTSSTTFKIRQGANGGGTNTFNGASSARLLGGVTASSITITEVKG